MNDREIQDGQKDGTDMDPTGTISVERAAVRQVAGSCPSLNSAPSCRVRGFFSVHFRKERQTAPSRPERVRDRPDIGRSDPQGLGIRQRL